MDARIYCRRILPIGLLYCGSLVCSNVVYLYLNISFIQMLKVFYFLSIGGNMLKILGGWPCCHTYHELVLEGRKTLDWSLHQHSHHNTQRRNGRVGGDQVFMAGFRFPVRESSL
jgi:hypothetical protein